MNNFNKILDLFHLSTFSTLGVMGNLDITESAWDGGLQRFETKDFYNVIYFHVYVNLDHNILFLVCEHIILHFTNEG